MTSTDSPTLPLLVEEVQVLAVRRVSASFLRLELGTVDAGGLSDLGPDGPLLDQRVKLLVPGPDGALPVAALRAAGAGWWTTWRALPEEERGHLRTYTVRERLGHGAATRVEIDVVLHSDGTDGHEGPGHRWARTAVPGARAVLVAPRRGHETGGIEWSPGSARRVMIAGDESAWPAVRGILRDLPPGVHGAAVVEVPTSADIGDVVAQVRDVAPPPGIDVQVLARDGGRRGTRLEAAVLAGLTGAVDAGPEEAIAATPPPDVDPDLWETPTHSSSGEAIDLDRDGATSDLYVWVAGEAGVVTSLRRALVGPGGLARHQVAFMGYWRA